jgi:integrase
MLNDSEIKRAKIQDKEYVLYDGDGLQITIRPTGTRAFEFRYTSPTTKRKQKIVIGKYPLMSLMEAREKRFELMKTIAQGKDPKEEREAQKNKGVTVHMIATSYMKYIKTELAPNTYKRNCGIINREIVRQLGDKPINEVTRFDVLKMIRDMEARDIIATSKMALKIITRMFRYALSEGAIEHNVCLDVDRGVLKKDQKENLPHMTNPKELSEFIAKVQTCTEITRLAIMFAMHTFLRPFNVRYLEWEEVDIDNKVIVIPGEKMKTRKPHIVPLTDSTIEILNEAKNFKNKYVFAKSSKPMSEMAMQEALKRRGYEHKQTVHGFRHTASTILNENISKHGVHSDAIEKQLAHATVGIKGVYNKAEYLEERVKLMQWWSQYLEQLHTP